MADENIVSAKPCTQTIGRIPLVPIRYGIVPKFPEDSQQFSWEGCGFNLEEDFTSIARLDCSKYTLRALREGYVYTYISSPKATKLIIHEHKGNGFFQELKIQCLEDYNSRDAYVSGRTMPNIWIEEDATEIWVSYSPHLWSKSKVTEILTNLKSRVHFMQPVDAAELVNCNGGYSSQKNILPLNALEQWVEEYKPEKERMGMRWSEINSFSPDIYALKSLKASFPKNQFKIPAVITLLDTEGVANDISAIANLYTHQVIDVGATSQEGLLPPAMQLDVTKLHETSKDFYEKSIISELIFNTLISLSSSEGNTSLINGIRNISHYCSLKETKSGARFVKRINEKSFLDFLEYKQKTQDDAELLYHQVERAINDHYKWLNSAGELYQSNRLSVAAALMTYDQEVKISAYSLEMSIAMMIDGLGNPIPGREDRDPRSGLLSTWLSDTQSPLYKALLAYAPFGKDANSVGGWLGASDSTIQEISKKATFMRATIGTDIITNNIAVHVLKRIKGCNSWHVDTTMLNHVNDAVADGDIQRVLGILRTRYDITGVPIESNPVSQQLKLLVESNMVELEKTKIRLQKGRYNRDLLVISEQNLHATPTDNLVSGKISTSISLAVASAGLLLFGMIYLTSAAKTVLDDVHNDRLSYGDTINFLAAVTGAMAGCNALLVSIQNLMKRNALDNGVAFAGDYYKKWLLKKIASAGFGKTIGIAAILFSFMSDFSKYLKNDTEGVNLRLASALTGGAGSLMVAFPAYFAGYIPGTVAALLPETVIPVVGWVILAGLALILIGIWLGIEADEENHTPFERWVNHTIFGAFISDENSTEEDLKPWPSLNEAVNGYFKVRYLPIMVDSTLARNLEHPDIYSRWELIEDSSIYRQGTVQFVLYFPDYTPGISDVRDITHGFTLEQLFPQNGGMLLKLSKKPEKISTNEAKLEIVYRPNTGFMNDVSVKGEYKLTFDWNQLVAKYNQNVIMSY